MRPFRTSVWVCALACLATEATPAQAAWNNVFQVCCNNCKSHSSFSAGACPDPCPQPCPPQQCTTRYHQRCYYEPVTTYQQYTWTEQVTSYRQSFYWEPCTSYRYSCYFDPCTCSYQKVATPVTSYRLRSQCCPVTSYLQRTGCKPVTTYRQSFYWVPETTCCQTTTGAPVTSLPPGASVVPSPGVTDSGTPPSNRPGVTDTQNPSDGMKFQRDSGFRQPPLAPAGGAAPPVQPPPAVKLDRIVYLQGPNVDGQVVASDRTPRTGARLIFVNADKRTQQHTTTTDRDGQFRVDLASGSWLVYVQGNDGKPVFHEKVDVKAGESRTVRLVHR